jgi:hypothetical protein
MAGCERDDGAPGVDRSSGIDGADHNTTDVKIYPFKKMIGNQPADANNTVLVPHLFSTKTGPNLLG